MQVVRDTMPTWKERSLDMAIGAALATSLGTYTAIWSLLGRETSKITRIMDSSDAVLA